MRYLTILMIALFFSCNEKPKKQTTEFNEKVVEFAIENSNIKFIELPNLYDSFSTEIVAKDEDKTHFGADS